MECSRVRKKLKEYANDEITNTDERLLMEEHVAGCPVCKRELLLWQEVMDRQRAVRGMQSKMPKELKDRIKYRMQKLQKGPGAPPLLKKMSAFTGKKGSLIIMFILICAALLSIFHFGYFKSRIVVPMLVFFGFAILFWLMLFRGNKKP
jgi:anti-sigma factor RsiW